MRVSEKSHALVFEVLNILCELCALCSLQICSCVLCRTLESEIVHFGNVRFFLFEFCSIVLFGVAFNVNRSKRTNRANGFAAAAPNANVRIDFGNGQRQTVRQCFVRNHGNRLSWAVFGTGSAAVFFDFYNAVVFNENNASHLDFVFLFYCQRNDGVVRADVAANGAVVIAESAREIQMRLHESFQTVLRRSWFENVCWTLRNAKMARRTIVVKMIDALRSGRGDGRFANVRRFTGAESFGIYAFRNSPGFCRRRSRRCPALT